MEQENLIQKRESKSLEFKESLSLKEEIGKCISAFSNNCNRTILIGVSDGGKVKGIEIGVSNLKESQISPFKNILTKSNVVKTGINDCSLRCGSLDQIAELLEEYPFWAVNNASARKSISSGSDIEDLAILRNSSYSTTLMNSIDSSISFCLISNSCSESLDLNKIISLYFSNSDFINSGAMNLALIEENKYAEIDLGFIIENKELLSNTKIILVYSYSPLSLEVIELSNSPLIFGDTLESNSLNLPFLAFLPSSTDHLINSCSSLEFNLSNNILPIFCLLDNSPLVNADQLIQTNLEISDFNSGVIANVIDAIYIIPLDFNSSSFLSSLILSDIILRTTSATFISGNSFLNSANSSSGTDTVILGILFSPSNYFNTSKYVRVFKSFDSRKEVGEGWDKIIEEHKNHSLKPKMPHIDFDKFSITVTLFSTKETFEKNNHIKDGINLSDIQGKIFNKLKKDSFFTADTLSKMLDINLRNTEKNISKLKELGLIKRIGSRKKGFWEVRDI